MADPAGQEAFSNDQVPEAELLEGWSDSDVEEEQQVTTGRDGVVVQLARSMTCEEVHAMPDSGNNRVPKFTGLLSHRYAATSEQTVMMLARDNTPRQLSIRIRFPNGQKSKEAKAKATSWKRCCLVGNTVIIFNGKRVAAKGGGYYLAVDEKCTIVLASPNVARTFTSLPVDNPPVSASRLKASLKHQQLTDALIHVFVKKVSMKKSTGNNKTFRVVTVADSYGLSYIKSWGRENSDWLEEELEVEAWFAIQNLKFTSTLDNQDRRWETFEASKEYTKIRKLTEKEVAAQEPIPSKLLADGDVFAMTGRFQAVWRCWGHYICARCSTKRQGSEVICEKCKKGGENNSTTWKWVWGGTCSVKHGDHDDVIDMVFSSKQVAPLLAPQVVADPSKTATEKMSFLAEQPVSIEYWIGGGDDGKDKIIKSMTLLTEKSAGVETSPGAA